MNKPRKRILTPLKSTEVGKKLGPKVGLGDQLSVDPASCNFRKMSNARGPLESVQATERNFISLLLRAK